ncbi:DNA-binding transcriptional LysR family regulator [Pseudomonas sp. SJZ079]|uniref:LysR family transcriptional regulator n=1 Tax=Pseudomonas sp. SJZ079 TaxID=2572887 RepID=UPI00119C3802|nr:LysR family transcriptional regulator [Pseudomonas sp. SJZ079]TWC39630.1 DNA-binding transcriptional LysR family regulator [Pseudomonas sp. SJZ079]
MDRYQQMRAFQAVAEDLSLAAAARRLSVSAATLTRAIATLEQRLGTALLSRSTRGVHLTEAGQRFALDCQRILHEVAEADESASGLHRQARGRLTLAMPLLFGQQVLTPILLDYLDAYREVQILGQYLDHVPNLHEEGVDVAIQVGELADSSLYALKVGSIRRVVCASPGYLAARGEPETPQSLDSAWIIHASADTRLPEWRFQHRGQALTVSLRPRLSCTTHQAAIAAACRGAGLTRCMSYQIHGQLQAGQLKTLLTDFELPCQPVHLVYREGRRAAARVRSFVDFAAAKLREHPALTPR